jgi:predicted metal-binding membrane protein
MTEAPLQSRLRRDRLVVSSGLVALVVASWADLVRRRLPRGVDDGQRRRCGGASRAPRRRTVLIRAAVVLVEKVVPRGDLIGRIAGLGPIAAGLLLAIHAFAAG